MTLTETAAATLEQLRRLPKAELHVHLDGSLRPETMLELAAEVGAPMPAADAVGLREFMRADRVRSLVDYLERFDLTLSVMQSAAALERITYELAADLAAENVRYAEIRYCPLLNTVGGLTLEEAVEAPLRALGRVETELPIRVRLILCAIRTMEPRTSEELAELAIAYQGRGVVAFDLAGAEDGNPASIHRAAFERIRRANMSITIHAGEAFGPDSIRQAIHDCGANRIGHGTHLVRDPDLMRYVRDHRIPVEACLTSNVQTGAVPSLADHPLGTFVSEDLHVSLNTDNRLVSGVSLTEEYERAHHHLGLSVADLGRLALMSFEGAFLPWPEKRTLVESAAAGIAAVLADDAIPDSQQPSSR